VSPAAGIMFQSPASCRFFPFGCLLLGTALAAQAALFLRAAYCPPDIRRCCRALQERAVTLRDFGCLTLLFLALYAVAQIILAGTSRPGPAAAAVAHSFAFHWLILVHTTVGLFRGAGWKASFGSVRARDALTGVFFYLAAVPVITLHGYIFLWLFRTVGLHPTSQPVVRLFASGPPGFRLYMLLLGCLVAPLAEEIYFRGYLLPLLLRRLTPLAAIVFSSAVFAAAHLHIYSAPVLFLVALTCSAAYMFTGSLLAAVAVHASFNTVNIVLALAAAGG